MTDINNSFFARCAIFALSSAVLAACGGGGDSGDGGGDGSSVATNPVVKGKVAVSGDALKFNGASFEPNLTDKQANRIAKIGPFCPTANNCYAILQLSYLHKDISAVTPFLNVQFTSYGSTPALAQAGVSPTELSISYQVNVLSSTSTTYELECKSTEACWNSVAATFTAPDQLVNFKGTVLKSVAGAETVLNGAISFPAE